MGQGLDGGHADECGEVRIGNIQLISMSFEIRANHRVSFALDGLNVFELAGTRGLLDEDAVKFGIDAVGVDHH